MADDVFSCDLPDLDGFIRELDLLKEDAARAVRKAMHEGNHVIAEEQRRLADATGVPFLSEHIREGGIYTTKSGGIGITSGYMSEAFEKHDGVQPGVVGLNYEFGRPGQSRTRSGSKMKQVRLRIPNKGAKRKYWLRAVPKEVEIEKGKISPRPHIRRGFDNKIEEAVNKTVEALERETGKVFNE